LDNIEGDVLFCCGEYVTALLAGVMSCGLPKKEDKPGAQDDVCITIVKLVER